jgi:excisionase family DNA binding protein
MAARAKLDTPLLSVKQAGALAGVSKDTIYRGIHDGQVPAIQVRGAYRVPRDETCAGFTASPAITAGRAASCKGGRPMRTCEARISPPGSLGRNLRGGYPQEPGRAEMAARRLELVFTGDDRALRQAFARVDRSTKGAAGGFDRGQPGARLRAAQRAEVEKLFLLDQLGRAETSSGGSPQRDPRA